MKRERVIPWGKISIEMRAIFGGWRARKGRSESHATTAGLCPGLEELVALIVA